MGDSKQQQVDQLLRGIYRMCVNRVIGGNSFITSSVEPNSKVSMKNLEKENKSDKDHVTSEEVKPGEEWFYVI